MVLLLNSGCFSIVSCKEVSMWIVLRCQLNIFIHYAGSRMYWIFRIFWNIYVQWLFQVVVHFIENTLLYMVHKLWNELGTLEIHFDIVRYDTNMRYDGGSNCVIWYLEYIYIYVGYVCIYFIESTSLKVIYEVGSRVW